MLLFSSGLRQEHESEIIFFITYNISNIIIIFIIRVIPVDLLYAPAKDITILLALPRGESAVAELLVTQVSTQEFLFTPIGSMNNLLTSQTPHLDTARSNRTDQFFTTNHIRGLKTALYCLISKRWELAMTVSIICLWC